MGVINRWRVEQGPRLQGSRDLDSSKLQAPGIARTPAGGYRLFYTGVGPSKPFPDCQGYILSAVSDDGLTFAKEPGIRLAPQPEIPHRSLRVLAPTVASCGDGRWRMYVEARGPADRQTVICSAISTDMLHWEWEGGIRFQGPDNVGGPRYLALPNGQGRLYCFVSEHDPLGNRRSQSVISAVTSDGLQFEREPGYRLRDNQAEYDTAGITAAEVIPPAIPGDRWTMFFSAWQSAPKDGRLLVHPSQDADAVDNGRSADFAAASIASDMSGYRSRIFASCSEDGLAWGPAERAIDGAGYGGPGLDAVHAEDMSLIEIEPGRYRMYYAACDAQGNWRVVSAVTVD